MSGKRETARKWSREGAIDDSGINQVYAALQEAVHVEQDPLPELDGPTTILPRRRLARSAGALPHSDDVRAVLSRALAVLDKQRPKSPELRYAKLALRRHLELGLTLDQAFGYAKVGKGAPLLQEDRALRIACAVFKHRFIDGRKAESAGYEAGKRFGVSKTQALSAFAGHAGYALLFHKTERLKRERNPLWTPDELSRLDRYYSSLRKRMDTWLKSQPDN